MCYVHKILLCNRSDGLCSLFEYPPEQRRRRGYGLTSNEGTVRKLNIPKDALEVLEKIVSSDSLMYKSKQAIISNITEGPSCCMCRGVPSHEVRYQAQDGGTTCIDRYCDNCMKKRYRNGVN